MEFKIKDLITNKISGEWGKEPLQGEGIKIIRTSNFTNLGVIDYDDIVYREISPNKISQKKLKRGDIIIEKSGGSPNQPVGRVVFFDLDSNENYLCNNFTTILRPDKSKVYPLFLFYQLFIGHLRGKTLKFQNKTTGIINLKLDKYLNEVINIPPLNEQIPLAQVFRQSEMLISRRKESNKLLDLFLKNIFFKMFGQGNDSIFPLKTLNEISIKITDGEHGTVERINHGRLYLMARNITNSNELDFSEISYISEKDHQKIFKRCNPMKDDLLMVCVGATIGKVALVPDIQEFSIARSVALIKPNRLKINPRYLIGFFNTNFGQRQIKNKSNESAQAGLYTGNLKKIKIPVPSKALQDEFSMIAEKVEAIKTRYTNSLKELENLFGSLSQRAYNLNLILKSPLEYIDEYYAETEKNEVLDKIIKSDNSKQTKKTDKKEIKELQKSKITWEAVSSQQIAEWIKERYDGFHFSSEMLIRFLQDECMTFPDYYSSEQLKKQPRLNGTEDLKSFIFSALNSENPFIKLKQHFYNAEKKDTFLNVNDLDFELFESKDTKNRSGIFFSIIDQ